MYQSNEHQNQKDFLFNNKNKKLLALKGDRLELESKEEEKEKKKKEKPWETEQWVRAAQD